MGRENPKKNQNWGVFWMAEGGGGGSMGWRWLKGMEIAWEDKGGPVA